MNFCAYCGTAVKPGNSFCVKCGAKLDPFLYRSSAYNDAADIADNKIYAILAYLSLLVLIPIFAAPKSRFAQFHANQGLSLCILWLAYTVTFSFLNMIRLPKVAFFSGVLYTYYEVPSFITAIGAICVLAIVALSIIGIYNAISGRYKELPVIGQLNFLSRMTGR